MKHYRWRLVCTGNNVWEHHVFPADPGDPKQFDPLCCRYYGVVSVAGTHEPRCPDCERLLPAAEIAAEVAAVELFRSQEPTRVKLIIGIVRHLRRLPITELALIELMLVEKLKTLETAP